MESFIIVFLVGFICGLLFDKNHVQRE